MTTMAVLPVPQWCTDHINQGIYAVRDLACGIFGVTLTTSRTTNGTTTVTGIAKLNVVNLAYTAKDQPLWGHQVQISSYDGWGDALKAQVQGSASGSGQCTTAGSSFPSQPITPFNTARNGESSFNTTATAVGTVGQCTTTWSVLFTTPGYNQSTLSVPMTPIRCDNATGGNPRTVGCVVPWYASAVIYTQSATPALASHVARAQASGLPGATFTAPLTRATPAINQQNRALACGDAPSLSGLSCDEYPVASSWIHRVN